ncbi:2-hydroxyacid dehydrogenase [Borborobacter arsenicus]|nr:glyoxylate/hydroxypyruvate reductase A [Pseudaminobacter arsenicus]
MRVVFHSESADPVQWQKALAEQIPGLELRVWPDVGDPAEIDAMLVWKIPPGSLDLYPNLKGIHLLSAGTDQIAGDLSIPVGLPVARLVEPAQVSGMVEYALHAVLDYHRHFDRYRNQQAARIWHEHPRIFARDRKVGILGLGALGAPVAQALAELDFDVAGWSRQPRELEGVKIFSGWDRLEAFLRRSLILIALLPLTAETRNLFDTRFFAKMPPGSYFINIGRGAQCVETDLCAALETGHLAGATLDVLQSEPPEPGNPLWSAPNLILTPHVATSPDPKSGAVIVAENLRRMRDGLLPSGMVKRP